MFFKLCISRTLTCLINPRSSSSSTNSKIRGCVQQGQYVEALHLYCTNPHSPLNTTKFIFPSLLKACASLLNLHHGKAIHSTIVTMGLQSDPFIATSLINLYVKCGSLSSAVQLFDKLSDSEISVQDVSVWNSIIDGYFRYGHLDEGIVNFRQMQLFGFRPDAYSLCILLSVCDGLLGYMEGKQIHGYMVRNMLNSDPFLDTALIDMYSKCGRPMDAWSVFEMLDDKNNVVAWNALIGGLDENGMWEYSLELYSLLKNENVKVVSVSFSSTLSAAWHGEDVSFGRQVHSDVIKMGFENDPYVYTSILTMYARCRLVEEAQKFFCQIKCKKAELWNSMISAYVGNGLAHDALKLYKKMRLTEISPDSFTMLNILSSCSMLGLCDLARSVHSDLVKRPMQSDMAVQSALLTMYAKCGSNDDARTVFSAMEQRDVVAWGSIISGFCQNQRFDEAFCYFRAMEADGLKPDSDIMASIISACTGLENVSYGYQIHCFLIKSGLERDVFVASSLIDMYSKYGFPEMARNVFTGMSYRNLVAWNSIISCYCLNGLPDMSIWLFPQIIQHGLYPDNVSITSVIVAVSLMAALLKGKVLHGNLMRLKIPFDLQVENALIDMYIKCGLLKYAWNIFQNMSQKNLVTWNSMIAGYGSHGECLKAMKLFDEMKSLGVKPDDITFLCLISSCNHSGLVEEGQILFRSMRLDYGIEPKSAHYVNIVDLLGRAGRLNDAFSFVQNMPIEPDRSIWLSVLSACQAHHNVELGQVAADHLIRLEPDRGSNYVQLLNLYRDAKLWYKAANLRASMREKGLKKSPGCSWVEVRNRVHVFFSRDSSSPKAVEMCETLKSLKKNMEKKGTKFESNEAFEYS